MFQILKNESESIKSKANKLFKEGEFETALSMYTQALKICPLIYSKERAILFANRAAAKSKLPVYPLTELFSSYLISLYIH